jgi:AcrR family transcriptional regulator
MQVPSTSTPAVQRRRDPVRTRQAILDAALELTAAAGRAPTAREIAVRAGIGERTLFYHFADLEELRGAVALWQARRWMALARPVDATWPVEQRVDALLDQREQMYELMTPVRRVGLAEESASSAIAAAMAEGDRWFRTDVAATFAPEVDTRPDGAAGGGLLDALDAAVSWAAWNHLRQRQGLSLAQARRAIRTTLLALLVSDGGA